MEKRTHETKTDKTRQKQPPPKKKKNKKQKEKFIVLTMLSK